VALARESGRALSAVLQTRAETLQIKIVDDQGAAHPVRLPVSALRLLVDVLTEIGEGNAVTIIPIDAELTPQEAADVLRLPHVPRSVTGTGRDSFPQDRHPPLRESPRISRKFQHLRRLSQEDDDEVSA